MIRPNMDRSYFEEKKEYAIEGVSHAQGTVEDVKIMLGAWNYDLPDLINAAEIHEAIRAGKAQLDGVRRNFEKVRWASSRSQLEFNEWLMQGGHADLIQADH